MHNDTQDTPRDVFFSIKAPRYPANDVKVRAPYDARQLLRRLGLEKDLDATPGQL